MKKRSLIDADACPVVRIAVDCARRHNVPVTLVCDFSHIYDLPDADVVTVEKGADSADYRLVNMIHAGDIVITQDYGLAAMSLARNACVISQNGLVYTDENIGSLLLARHTARKLRNAGMRMKGPSARTRDQDLRFLECLERLLNEPAP